MKTNAKAYVALCAATLILSNCDDSNLDTSPPGTSREKMEITNRPIGEQYKYVSKNLATIAKGLLPLTHDQNFRNSLYLEVEKQFDGDENVLLKQLIDGNPQLMSKLNESKLLEDDESVANALESFTNIGSGGKVFSLFPQIYIHNYFNLKPNLESAKLSPTIAVYNGDESTTLVGWSLSNTGEVKERIVDENFALENEVWVVSLNETYNQNSRGRKIDESNSRSKYAGSCIVTPSGNRDNTNWAHMQMNKLMIACGKESWAGGNSDVNITRYTAYENFIDPDTQEHHDAHWLGNSDGVQLISVDPSSLGQCYSMSFIAYHGMNPDDEIDNIQGSVGDIFYYVVFEHDTWPSPDKTQQVDFTNQTYPFTYTTLHLPYRSSESPYFSGVVTAKPIYRNCGYFGCAYFSEQVVDAFSDNSCGEVSWKTILDAP